MRHYSQGLGKLMAEISVQGCGPTFVMLFIFPDFFIEVRDLTC